MTDITGAVQRRDEYIGTFASLLVERLLENGYPIGTTVQQLTARLVDATHRDCSEERPLLPRAEDVEAFSQVQHPDAADARRRYPCIARCIEACVEGSMELQKKAATEPTTVADLERAVRERSMAEHPPHWKVQFLRGLVRIESHHPCGCVLVRDGRDLPTAARLMLDTIDAMRKCGVLP